MFSFVYNQRRKAIYLHISRSMRCCLPRCKDNVVKGSIVTMFLIFKTLMVELLQLLNCVLNIHTSG